MAGLIDPSVIDKVDPQFVEIYNKYQGWLSKFIPG